jgi:nitronate monooxygenase
VTAQGEDTVLTDGFVLNWPKGSVVRVLRNSVTETFGPALMGHDPERIAHEVIARDGLIPRLRQSTDSPLRTTTGDLEQMPLYCGTGAGEIDEIVPAAQRLNTLCAEAQARLASGRQTPVGRT